MIIEFDNFVWLAGIGSLLLLAIAAAALYGIKLRLSASREKTAQNAPSRATPCPQQSSM